MSLPWRCWHTKGPVQLQVLFDIGSWVGLQWGFGDRSGDRRVLAGWAGDAWAKLGAAEPWDCVECLPSVGLRKTF